MRRRHRRPSDSSSDHDDPMDAAGPVPGPVASSPRVIGTPAPSVPVIGAVDSVIQTAAVVPGTCMTPTRAVAMHVPPVALARDAPMITTVDSAIQTAVAVSVPPRDAPKVDAALSVSVPAPALPSVPVVVSADVAGTVLSTAVTSVMTTTHVRREPASYDGKYFIFLFNYIYIYFFYQKMTWTLIYLLMVLLAHLAEFSAAVHLEIVLILPIW